VADCSKAVELDPTLASVWTQRAIAYNRIGQFEKAIDDCSKAIELDRNVALSWHTRGQAYSALRQYEKAVADFSEALRFAPFNFAFVNRGMAYLRLKQYDKVVADFSKVIENFPKYARARAIRGIGYARLGEYEKAIADLSQAIELEPNYVPALLNRGGVYRELHQYERAVADYKEVLRLDARNPGACGYMALLLANARDPKFRDPVRALQMAKRATDLLPQEASFWTGLGLANLRAGDSEAAVKALDRAVQLSQGGDGFDWFLYAMARWQLGQKDEARQWYERAVQWMDKNQPKDEQYGRIRAEAAELLGGKLGAFSSKPGEKPAAKRPQKN